MHAYPTPRFPALYRALASLTLTVGCGGSPAYDTQAAEQPASAPGTETVASTTTECGRCIHGQCINGTCMCEWGYAGSDCASCAEGSSGDACRAGQAAVSAAPRVPTAPDGPSAAPTPAASSAAPRPSLLRGVAPLGVFFDASEIPGMADGDFLNAHITWDFGDARAGQYETTRGARYLDSGFVV